MRYTSASSPIVKNVLRWYAAHRRNLPWRRTRDPYKILVSEVMLQQTQVDRVLPKYKEFLKKFPTAWALAQAPTAEVIRAWKGLGYNRRALYVQKAAQAVVSEYGGKFPKDIALLKQLPGVGDYTARAILAFAYEEPVPVLDTNHRRFYQRVFFGLRQKTDKKLLAYAEQMMPIGRVYDWNQALMDFGSLVCVTGKPKCEACPVRKWCKAFPRLQRSDFRLQSRKKLKHEDRRPKAVPFRQTDRYFRGRIIDYVREHGRATDRIFETLFPELPKERYQDIIQKLEYDGLIARKNNRILLP